MAVKALPLISILLSGPVIAQQTDCGGDFGAIRCYRSAITESAEILAGVETPCDCITVSSDAFPSVTGSMCLGAVFKNLKTVTACNLQNRIQVCRLTVKVDRNNSFGARRNNAFDVDRIDVAGATVRF